MSIVNLKTYLFFSEQNVSYITIFYVGGAKQTNIINLLKSIFLILFI